VFGIVLCVSSFNKIREEYTLTHVYRYMIVILTYALYPVEEEL
jgi:hypothetical protein